MHTNALMNLLRISDSFFPIGSFTASQGTEQFVADEFVDNGNLEEYLTAYLHNVWVPLEIPVFREALSAIKSKDFVRLLELDHSCYVSKLSEESRTASARIGNNLSVMLENSDFGNEFCKEISNGSTPGTYPVVLALISDELDIGNAAESSLLYVNLMEVAAAMVRMGEIDYLEAQNAVKHVLEDIPESPIFGEEYQSFPLADIESMRHENNTCRMFMS